MDEVNDKIIDEEVINENEEEIKDEEIIDENNDKIIDEEVINENKEETVDEESSFEEEMVNDDQIINEEENEVLLNEVVDETFDNNKNGKKPKKPSKRKLKKQKKFNDHFFGDADIKYVGPLSYRYLRLIAWFSLALSQLLIINTVCINIAHTELVSGAWYVIVTIIASLYVPLFIMATFATILNKNNTYKSVLIFYTVAYLGISLGIVFVYRRYLFGIVSTIFEDPDMTAGSLIGRKFEINVFADLLALSLFNFFINYNPKKFFAGKKIIIFRLLSIIPIAVALVSYLLKCLEGLEMIMLPFEIFPFLTTKPPLLYLLFIVLSIWIKRREKIFTKRGYTEEDYNKFTKTNKNSLDFSKKVCILFLIISAIDFVLLIFTGVLAYMQGLDVDYYWNMFQIGNCAATVIAIPVILLFSYTKKYDDTKLDLIVPLIGLGMVAFAYIEGIYQVAMIMLRSS